MRHVNKLEDALGVLSDKNIKAVAIGVIVPKEKGMVLVDNGVEKKLTHPEIDPFWSAFAREVMR